MGVQPPTKRLLQVIVIVILRPGLPLLPPTTGRVVGDLDD